MITVLQTVSTHLNHHACCSRSFKVRRILIRQRYRQLFRLLHICIAKIVLTAWNEVLRESRHSIVILQFYFQFQMYHTQKINLREWAPDKECRDSTSHSHFRASYVFKRVLMPNLRAIGNVYKKFVSSVFLKMVS